MPNTALTEPVCSTVSTTITSAKPSIPLRRQTLHQLITSRLQQQDEQNSNARYLSTKATPPSTRKKKVVHKDTGLKSVTRRSKFVHHDSLGNEYATTRAPRVKYTSFKKPRREDDLYFDKKVQEMVKQIFSGSRTKPPFRIIVIDKAIDDFYLAKNIVEDSPKFEDANEPTLKLVEESVIVVDRDYYPLILSARSIHWFSDGLAKTQQAMERLPHVDSGGSPAANDFKNKRKEDMALQWVYTFIFEQGHSYRRPLLSKDTGNSSAQRKASTEFLRELEEFGMLLSCLIKILDEDFWSRAREVCKNAGIETDCLQTNKWEVFLNTMIIMHKTSMQHIDTLDVKRGFAAIASYNNFEKGYLCFPDLGIKFPHRPGDIILFRSHYLRHYLRKYTDTRYAIIRFMREEVMRFVEERCIGIAHWSEYETEEQ
jgi:hypothetical protein